MIAPVIHLNGTSAQALQEDIRNALDALRAAIKAVQATAPNGRDYYTLGLSAIMTAMDQHATRLQRLKSSVEELTEIYLAIDAQVNR